MNNPDLHKIITEIAGELMTGMRCFLNVDTGEIVVYPSDSYVDIDTELFDEDLRKVNDWAHVVVLDPLESNEGFEMMEDFITENTREGSALYSRLMESLRRRRPFASFKQELVECDGLQHWYKFKDDCYYTLVKNRIIEEVGLSKVKIYKLNQESRQLMALARMAGRYCYVDNAHNRVIISQVRYQPDFTFKGDEMVDLETDYTLMEQILMRAEEYEFHRYGGGLVLEPCDPDEETLEEMEYENVLKGIDRSIEWMADEEAEFEDFCREQDVMEALVESEEFDFIPARPLPDKKEIRFDGKYPVPGKPDDRFTEDDPWGTPDFY